MNTATYLERRGRSNLLRPHRGRGLGAADLDAPVGRIRATVRAGRDRMRARCCLAARRPARRARARRRLRHRRAGVEAARRGAQVVAIDLSPTLVELARDALPRDLGNGAIDFASATCSIRRSASSITSSRWIR
jgi:magnesium-protoporphyrin O-methyltransferase